MNIQYIIIMTATQTIVMQVCFTIITAELDKELEPEESTEPDDTADEEDSIPPNAEEIVANGLAAGTISNVCDVSVTMRPMDTEEERLIHEFAQHGCTCDHGYDKTPCCKSFTEDHYLSFRCAFTEMTHDELDLFVMGQIMANCHQSPQLDSADERNTMSCIFTTRADGYVNKHSFSYTT